MAKKPKKLLFRKTDDYLAALITINGKYLLFRNIEDSLFEKYGFFFPGCHANKKYSHEAYLKEELRLKYGLNVTVEKFIGDALSRGLGKKFECEYMYKCLLDGGLSIVNKDVSYMLIEPLEFERYRFDELDTLLSKRVELFHHVYQGEFAQVSRKEEEKSSILSFYECLIYFKDEAAHQDINDFKDLIQTKATFTEIKNAFDWIMERNQLSYDKFLAYKEKAKK